MMKFTWNILMSIGYEVTNEKQPLTYLSVLTYDIAIGKQTLTCFSFISMLSFSSKYIIRLLVFLYVISSSSHFLSRSICIHVHFSKIKTYKKKLRNIKSQTKYIYYKVLRKPKTI